MWPGLLGTTGTSESRGMDAFSLSLVGMCGLPLSSIFALGAMTLPKSLDELRSGLASRLNSGGSIYSQTRGSPVWLKKEMSD